MRVKSLVLLGVLLGLGLAAPALAGTVYVPFVGPDADSFVDRPSHLTTITVLQVYNLGAQQRRLAVRFVEAGQDGTASGAQLHTSALPPAGAGEVDCCLKQSGLLLVSGAPQIAVGASLSETLDGAVGPNGISTRLPVLTARDALPPGTRAVLLSLFGTSVGSQRSSLGIVNFGSREARCSVSQVGSRPQFFTDLLDLHIPPLSLWAAEDVLQRVRGPLGPVFYDAQPLVTCDQPFYPFAINYGGITTGIEGIPSGARSIEVVPPSVQLTTPPL